MTHINPMPDIPKLIDAHIRACAARKDGRGRWRLSRDLATALERAGTPASIAANTAQAAERIGAWLGLQ